MQVFNLQCSVWEDPAELVIYLFIYFFFGTFALSCWLCAEPIDSFADCCVVAVFCHLGAVSQPMGLWATLLCHCWLGSKPQRRAVVTYKELKWKWIKNHSVHFQSHLLPFSCFFDFSHIYLWYGSFIFWSNSQPISTCLTHTIIHFEAMLLGFGSMVVSLYVSLQIPMQTDINVVL